MFARRWCGFVASDELLCLRLGMVATCVMSEMVVVCELRFEGKDDAMRVNFWVFFMLRLCRYFLWSFFPPFRTWKILLVVLSSSTSPLLSFLILSEFDGEHF